jgi:protein SCO1
MISEEPLGAADLLPPAARLSPWLAALALAVLTLTAGSVWAQITEGPASSGYKMEPGMSSSTVPPTLRDVGFDQNLNQQVPLDARFTDEQGRAVQLGDYFGQKPVILVMAYYNCPMLCIQVLNGLAASLNVQSTNAGADYDVVVISIDPREGPSLAATKKATFLERYRHPDAAAGIHFLTGTQEPISRVAKAVGFRYVWDENLKQFAHPTGIVVTTPSGLISRYLFGVEYGPRDLRLALVESSAGAIGTPTDALLLYCYHYDPQTGRYGLVVMALVRIAGAATALALGAFVVVMVRRERRASRPPAGTGESSRT